MTKIRNSLAAERTLAVIASQDPRPVTGAEICQTAGLESGTVYPLLVSFQESGLVDVTTSTQEKGRATGLYALTEAGRLAVIKTFSEIAPLYARALGNVAASLATAVSEQTPATEID